MKQGNGQPTMNFDRRSPDGTTPDDLMRRAVILHQQGSLADALELYRKVLNGIPDHTEALKLSGIAALHLGFLDEAVANLSQAASMWTHDAVINFNLGFAFDQLDRLDEAVQAYERAAMIVTDEAVMHSNLGNALRRVGRLDEAISSCRRAIDIQPDYATAYQNLGVALEAAGRSGEAMDIFRRAIELRPDNGEAWLGLGNALRDGGQPEEAVEAFRHSLELLPDRTDIHNNMCNVLLLLGRGEEAESASRRALELDKDCVPALLNLGSIQQDQGLLEDAIQSYRRALAVDPENAGARHMLAALTGETTEAASNDYVAKLFDSYAPFFENHLTTVLNYRGPTQLRDAVERALHARQLDSSYRFDRVLDLGCGTGLIAAAFDGRIDRIYGVDLSAKMLERARSKGLYQELFLDDLTSFLENSENARDGYDLITAADLFVYIGDPSDVFANVHDRLRSKGLFAFTIENLESGTYKLLPTGRFAQSVDYVYELTKSHGFKLEIQDSIIVRNEPTGPIDGFVFVLVKQDTRPDRTTKP